MIRISNEKLNLFGILLALVSVTLFIAPQSAFHPYSIPKLVPLVSISFSLVPTIITMFHQTYWRKYKFILVTIFAHLFIAAIVLFYPQRSLQQGLYGISGRNNGFLTHISYVILMMAAILIVNAYSIKKIVDTTLLIGWVVLIYGFLQKLKLVEIANITGFNNRSTGFFGNINFYSAFIALMTIINFSLLFDNLKSNLNKLIRVTYICLGIIGIYTSESQQGFLVLAVGLSIVFYVKLKLLNKKIFLYAFTTSIIPFFTLVVLGIFQIGPIAKYVYEKSISYRGYYWRAGINIFKENILFGTGFDGYRDWYRRFREPAAVLVLGPKDLADSAHNYFIDLAVSGGVFLLITYLILIVYAMKCSISILRNLHFFDSYIVAIIAVFYGFTVQQLLSVPQQGLTLWGWVYAGLVISIYKNRLFIKSVEIEQKITVQKTPNYFVIMLFFLIGLILTVPAFANSNNFRKSVEIQDSTLLYDTARKFPQDANLLAAASRALISLNDFTRARTLLLDGTIKFPQYYEIWYLYSLLPNLTDNELKIIDFHLKELEPLLSQKR